MLLQHRQILSILYPPRCAHSHRSQHPPRLAPLGRVGLGRRLARERRDPIAKRHQRDDAAAFIAELRLELKHLVQDARFGVVGVPFALERLLDV